MTKQSEPIHLNLFQPRWYQEILLDALENKKYRNVLCIMSRRAGKEVVAWNALIRHAIRKPRSICYAIYPTYNQARKVLWDGILGNGVRFLDFIPKQLISSIHSTLMQIKLKNGSLIQVVGGEPDKLVGTNANFIYISEAALTSSDCYLLMRPILAHNGGTCLIITTPRGYNWVWDLYNQAQDNPDWFVIKLGVEQTKHISEEALERERAELPPRLFDQEFHCSFAAPNQGSYYAEQIEKMRIDGRIGMVPWESDFPVEVVTDIGYTDNCVWLFFQRVGTIIRIIDCYANSQKPLPHYVAVINSKPYKYSKFWGPHDLRAHEFGSGLTRHEMFKNLGIKFSFVDNIGIMDGIEAARAALMAKIWIDEEKCKSLIKALTMYRSEWDEKRKVFKDRPLHDTHSDWADALRYLVLSLPKSRDGLTPEKLDLNYQNAMTSQSNLPAFFQDNYNQRIY